MLEYLHLIHVASLLPYSQSTIERWLGQADDHHLKYWKCLLNLASCFHFVGKHCEVYCNNSELTLDVMLLQLRDLEYIFDVVSNTKYTASKYGTRIYFTYKRE